MMNPIWYEYNDSIFDLSKAIMILKLERKASIQLWFSVKDSEFFQLEFKNCEDQDTEFERIKTILDKIH